LMGSRCQQKKATLCVTFETRDRIDCGPKPTGQRCAHLLVASREAVVCRCSASVLFRVLTGGRPRPTRHARRFCSRFLFPRAAARDLAIHHRCRMQPASSLPSVPKMWVRGKDSIKRDACTVR
jgi:hypothetical protein